MCCVRARMSFALLHASHPASLFSCMPAYLQARGEEKIFHIKGVSYKSAVSGWQAAALF
jgi:hypothetical protein